jgi:hypothetical protein
VLPDGRTIETIIQGGGVIDSAQLPEVHPVPGSEGNISDMSLHEAMNSCCCRSVLKSNTSLFREPQS